MACSLLSSGDSQPTGGHSLLRWAASSALAIRQYSSVTFDFRVFYLLLMPDSSPSSSWSAQVRFHLYSLYNCPAISTGCDTVDHHRLVLKLAANIYSLYLLFYRRSCWIPDDCGPIHVAWTGHLTRRATNARRLAGGTVGSPVYTAYEDTGCIRCRSKVLLKPAKSLTSFDFWTSLPECYQR